MFFSDLEADFNKYYVLEMFPYPSGRIHMGHVRNYTMGDVVARYKRAKGFNVLHPMGWDAFGLPAENAAMEARCIRRLDLRQHRRRCAPAQAHGPALDWSREIATCEPDYYGSSSAVPRLPEGGLVYRKEAKVNWDPVDMTVLANEQVIDGRGWRSARLVEQRKLPVVLQDHRVSPTICSPRSIRSTAGRTRSADAGELDRQVRRGCRFRFAWPGAERRATARGLHHPPDTLFGAASCRHRADHPLAPRQRRTQSPRSPPSSPSAARSAPARPVIETAEKLGFDTGIAAVHPFDPRRKLPVYVANFVLMEYGTGAIFGCPAHDQRDLDFARKYGLPVRRWCCRRAPTPRPSRSATRPTRPGAI
jgi:leucyl-tRNA synthetase